MDIFINQLNNFLLEKYSKLKEDNSFINFNLSEIINKISERMEILTNYTISKDKMKLINSILDSLDKSDLIGSDLLCNDDKNHSEINSSIMRNHMMIEFDFFTVVLIFFVDLGKNFKFEISKFLTKNSKKYSLIKTSSIIIEFISYLCTFLKERNCEKIMNDIKLVKIINTVLSSLMFYCSKEINLCSNGTLLLNQSEGKKSKTDTNSNNEKHETNNNYLNCNSVCGNSLSSSKEISKICELIQKNVLFLLKSNFEIIINSIITGEYDISSLVFIKEITSFICKLGKNYFKNIELSLCFKEFLSKEIIVNNSLRAESFDVSYDNKEFKGVNFLDTSNLYFQLFLSYLKLQLIGYESINENNINKEYQSIESIVKDFDLLILNYKLCPKIVFIAIKSAVMNIEYSCGKNEIEFLLNYEFKTLEFINENNMVIKVSKCNLLDFFFNFCNSRQLNCLTFTTQIMEVATFLFEKFIVHLNELISNVFIKIDVIDLLLIRLNLDKQQFGIVETINIELIERIIITSIKKGIIDREQIHKSILKFLINNINFTKENILKYFNLNRMEDLKIENLSEFSHDSLLDLIFIKLSEMDLMKHLDYSQKETIEFFDDLFFVLFKLGFNRKSISLISEILKVYIDSYLKQMKDYKYIVEKISIPFFNFVNTVELKNLKFLSNIFESMLKQNPNLFCNLVKTYHMIYLEESCIHIDSSNFEIHDNTLLKTKYTEFLKYFSVFFFLVKSFRTYKNKFIIGKDKIEILLDPKSEEENEKIKNKQNNKKLKSTADAQMHEKKEEMDIKNSNSLNVHLSFKVLNLLAISDNWEQVVCLNEFLSYLPTSYKLIPIILNLMKFNLKSSYIEFRSTVIADLKTYFENFLREFLRSIKVADIDLANDILDKLALILEFTSLNLFMRPSEILIPYLEIFHFIFCFFYDNISMFILNQKYTKIFTDIYGEVNYDKHSDFILLEFCSDISKNEKSKQIILSISNKLDLLFKKFIFTKDKALILLSFLKESWYHIRYYSLMILFNKGFEFFFKLDNQSSQNDINNKTKCIKSDNCMEIINKLTQECIEHHFSFRQMELEGSIYFFLIFCSHNNEKDFFCYYKDNLEKYCKMKFNENSLDLKCLSELKSESNCDSDTIEDRFENCIVNKVLGFTKMFHKLIIANNSVLLKENETVSFYPHFLFVSLKLCLEVLSNINLSIKSNQNEEKLTSEKIINFLSNINTLIISKNNDFCSLLVNNGVSNISINKDNNSKDLKLNSNNDTLLTNNMNQLNINEETEEIDFSGSEDVKLVSIWITVKYSLLSLSSSLTCIVKNKGLRIESKNVLVQNYPNILKNLDINNVITLMKEYKHMGAILLLKENLEKMCGILNRSNYSEDNEAFSYLTNRVLKNFIYENLAENELCSILRRSAGIPHILLTLIKSYLIEDKFGVYNIPNFKSLFSEVIYSLTSSFNKYISEGKISISVHCLNILRVLCDDSTLKSQMQIHYEHIFIDLIDHLESKNWSIRNALMLMFSRIIKASFDNLAGSSKNSSYKSSEVKTFSLFFSNKLILLEKLKRKMALICNSNSNIDNNDDLLILITTILANVRESRLIDFNTSEKDINLFCSYLLKLHSFKSKSEILYYQISVGVEKLLGCKFNIDDSEILKQFLMKDNLLENIKNQRFLHVYFNILDSLAKNYVLRNLGFSKDKQESNINYDEKNIIPNEISNHSSTSLANLIQQISLIINLKLEEKSKSGNYLFFRYFSLVNMLISKKMMGLDFEKEILKMIEIFIKCKIINGKIHLHEILEIFKLRCNEAFLVKTYKSIIDILHSLDIGISLDFNEKIIYEIQSQELITHSLEKKVVCDYNNVVKKLLDLSLIKSIYGYYDNQFINDIRLSFDSFNAITSLIIKAIKCKKVIISPEVMIDLLQNVLIKIINNDIELIERIFQSKHVNKGKKNRNYISPHILNSLMELSVILFINLFSLEKLDKNEYKSKFVSICTNIFKNICERVSSVNEDYVRISAFECLEIMLFNLVLNTNVNYFNLISSYCTQTNNESDSYMYNDNNNIEELFNFIYMNLLLAINDENPEIRSRTSVLVELFYRKIFIKDNDFDLKYKFINDLLFLKSFDYHSHTLINIIMRDEDSINIHFKLIISLIKRNFYMINVDDKSNSLLSKSSVNIFYKEPENRFIDLISIKNLIFIRLLEVNNTKINEKFIHEFKTFYDNNFNLHNVRIFFLHEKMIFYFTINIHDIYQYAINNIKSLNSISKNDLYNLIKDKLYSSYLSDLN